MVYDRLWWLLRRLLFLFFLFLSKLLTNDSGFCSGLGCFGRHSFRALHSGTLQVLCRKHSRLSGSVLVVIPGSSDGTASYLSESDCSNSCTGASFCDAQAGCVSICKGASGAEVSTTEVSTLDSSGTNASVCCGCFG